MAAKYIGVKLIEAFSYNETTADGEKEGYKVRYADGYTSWSPKEVFEKAYMKVIENPALKSGCSISQEMVDGFIKEVNTTRLGEKTTCVRAVLVNGFEIVESSACVDPQNYDEQMGKEICLKKIKDKIWFLLGFLLQTAVGGVK
ncbi:MAG: Gp49 family protein [Syntrophotalea acetylenica]|nr:Gp49 family protein [Syntrophotalea acetylenica]